ncbi:glycosyl hydrolase family 8 [Altericroceibacterium xinjiangense]|uniref:glycosyl hydrolase family 8 n=1 Tax=Altericroceibacterium xinjiangense TaxID=762261 RepID=UPI000F7E775B|nr:glycosyl hydrolase family 8 [Altericroceibacterium xinjiangense]
MRIGRRKFGTFLLAGLSTACTIGAPRATAAKESLHWPLFKTRFLDSSGRIVDTGNNRISHSEGQGYGMVLAVKAGDRPAFDKIWRWTKNNLRQGGNPLFAWRYDPRLPQPVSDPNNATDGDLLIAWALGEAGQVWGVPSLLTEARVIRKAVLARLTVDLGGLKLLLPGEKGFLREGAATLNPSYYVWPALESFARVAPGEGWQQIIIDGSAFLTRARFGPAGLPTDWVEMLDTGEVRPAPDREPRFGFDAVRVPLYAALAGRSGLARPVTEYWRSRLAAGAFVPAWVDVKTGEVAEYSASEGVLAIVSLVTGTPAGSSLSSDYYAAVLQSMAALR